jgi:hypothetical protein
LIASLGAVLLAALIYAVQRLPSADSLPDDHQLRASTIQTLALYNLRAGPVLQYDGALGGGLRVSVSTGGLTPETRQSLAALGAQLPNVKATHVQWQGRPAADGRITVRVGNARQSPEAGLMLQATGTGQTPEISLRAVQTGLTLEIDVASQDSGAGASAEMKFGDSDVADPALAFVPVHIDVPPGEYVNLTFDNPQAEADSAFRFGALLGTGGGATALSVGGAEVGRFAGTPSYPQLRAVSESICASSPGRILFTHLTPRREDCQLGNEANDDNLFATKLEVEPDKLLLNLEGSGFTTANGRTQPAPLFSTIMGNPVVAALMAALIAAVVRSLWRLWGSDS